MADHMGDLLQYTVMVVLVMVMVVHGVGFLLPVHLHRHMGAAYPAAGYRFITVGHMGDADGVQFRQCRVTIQRQLQQRSGQHIASRTHTAVQIQGFHGDTSIFRRCITIILDIAGICNVHL